ncbi:MAG: M23 family metallopeptidase [Clostridia bacterium]|nr:M23 family metallopeptidase [Clostridia bacterium]
MSRGFYIAVCSVVAVVGFSVYSAKLRADMDKQVVSFEAAPPEETESLEEVEVIDVDNAASDTDPGETVTGFEKVPEVVETVAGAKAKAEEAKFVMDLPCKGGVIAECSIDELVYSETMKDWRTHNGIDIAAKVGDQVNAAEAGIVSKVFKDELLGVVVTIDHGNGILSTYANLQDADFIKVGTKVKKGDIIGGVGECGALEKNLEPHLHFEISVDGNVKDPKEFLKY